jgi:HK97 gp10 family phage protein
MNAELQGVNIVLKQLDALSNLDEVLSEAALAAANVIEGTAKEYCPVDTGFLMNSIVAERGQDKGTAYVTANAEYAPYVEFGTKNMAAQSYMRTGASKGARDATRAAQNVVNKAIRKAVGK